MLSGILLHGQGFPGERGFLNFETLGIGKTKIGGNLAAGIQKNNVAGNQIACGDLPRSAVLQYDGAGTCHFLQGVQRALGFALLNHANHCVDQDHRQNDGSVTVFSEKQGDGCGDEQNEDQRIVELLAEAPGGGLSASLRKNVVAAFRLRRR